MEKAKQKSTTKLTEEKVPGAQKPTSRAYTSAKKPAKKSVDTKKLDAGEVLAAPAGSVNADDVSSMCKLPTDKKKTKAKKPSDLSSRSVNQSVRIVDGGREVASLKQHQIDSYDELESYKRLLRRRRKRLLARLLVFLLLIIVAPVIVFFSTIVIDRNGAHNFFGLKFYIIATDSMEPEIMVNDCVVLQAVSDIDELQIGDDIGYVNSRDQIVVHRIVDIVEQDGVKEFVTEGINAIGADTLRVQFDKVVGKRVATMHVLGNAVVFFRSTSGIILLAVIFVCIVGGFIVAFRLSEDIRSVENID